MPFDWKAQDGGSVSRDDLDLVVNYIPQLAWMADATGSIFWYSERWFEYTGTTLDEMQGWGWQKAHHPDHVSRVVEKIKTSFDTGVDWEDTFPLRAKDGSYRWFLSRARPIRDADSRIVRWFGSNTDVTELRAVEAALRSSEARLQLVLNSATTVGTWDWDIKHDRVVANARFAAMYGVDPVKAAAGTPIADFLSGIHPEDLQRVDELVQRAVETAGEFEAEYRLVSKDSGIRWVLARGHSYNDGHGTPERFPGIAFDITDRRQDEIRGAALFRLTERWRDITDPAEIAYAAAELLGQSLGVSRAGYGTVDLAKETITIERDWNAPGIKSLAGTLHFRDYGSYIEDLKRGDVVVFADAETDPRTKENAAALKAISAQSVVNMPVSEQGGLVALLYLNHREVRPWSESDLTFIREVAERTRTAVERVRGAARLHESESRFRGVTEALPGFVWTARADGELDYTSPHWIDYSGAGAGESLGSGWASFVHQDDIEKAGQKWSVSVQSGALYEAEFRLRRKDGIYRWWLVRAVPARNDGGAITRWIGSATDIDQIVDAREVMARSREQLEQLVVERTADRDRIWRLSPDVMLVSDFEARLIAVNPAWTMLLGWDESDLLGRSFVDFVHPDDRDSTLSEVGKLGEGATTFRFENRYKAKDGSYRVLSWTAVPDSNLIHAIGRDVTSEREAEAALARTEESLRQAQKMEAVGQLTGGIAHDFNNMLAVVIGSLDLLNRRMSTEDARVRRYVAAAADGAKRAADLTQRLLAFSRQQPLRPEPIKANKLITDMSDLLRRSLGASIQMETVLAGGLWRTHADANQLENLVLNLAVNARDAMPDGGRLTIETQNAHLDEHYAAANPGAVVGQYVLIAVTDNGSGMTKQTVTKAFDPFFTTKEIGKGTGLGLSQAYGFVRQSGGHIKIYSEISEGTTVKVYLPRLLSTEDEVPAPGSTTIVSLGERQEVVLVVEDEMAVREFSIEALTELGYHVIAAENAATALKLLDTHPEIVLLFTDVVMPETNGAKLAKEARRLRPNLKVLFTTGYTRNAIVHNGALDHGVEMIGKPFTIEELANKVREVLDSDEHRR